jgi:hypothetical protein
LSNPQGLNIPDYLTDAEVDALIVQVAGRVNRVYSGQVDKTDVPGWVGLGVVKAARRFKVELLNADRGQAIRQVRGWLMEKGYFETIDLMRNAKCVERSHKGSVRQTVIRAKQFSALGDDDSRRKTGVDPTDRQPTPPEVAEARDIFAWAEAQLRTTERDIVHYYYRCRLPMYHVGVILNLSEARVSQLHTAVLDKLRSAHGPE